MRSFHTNKAKLVFILPGFVLFTMFVTYSVIPCVVMSLQNHNGAASMGWVGIQNYITALKNPAFWAAHKNTYWLLAIELILGITGSLILALMLDQAGKTAKAVYRFAALFPVVLSVTVVGKFFILGIFDTNVGLLNTILSAVGLEHLTRSWLTDPETVMTCVAVAYVWQYLGMNSLLFYTGIRTIPKEFYEAAQLDGANFLQASWHVTLPLLQDVFKYVLIGATIGTLGMYSQIAVMTKGGPGDTLMNLSLTAYQTAFQYQKFGPSLPYILVLWLAINFLAKFIVNKQRAAQRQAAGLEE